MVRKYFSNKKYYKKRKGKVSKRVFSRKRSRQRINRRKKRGGGLIRPYPLSSCGGATGGCDPYFGTANQNGGWRIDNASGKKNYSVSRKRTRRYRAKRGKKRGTRTIVRGGSSARNPILSSEISEGLFSIWNNGVKTVNTWKGMPSPSSLNASPLSQPIGRK